MKENVSEYIICEMVAILSRGDELKLFMKENLPHLESATLGGEEFLGTVIFTHPVIQQTFD